MLTRRLLDRPLLRGPLADRRFRLLWAGQSVSSLGDAVVPVALALAVVDASRSAADLGLILASAMVPRLLLTLAGGVWADRLPRHRVMIAADTVNLLAQLGMGVELVSGGYDLVTLMALSAASGAAAAFFGPASIGLVPSTVDASELRGANVLMGISQQSATVVGPALATLFALTVGCGWAMIFDAATFAVGIGALLVLRVDDLHVEREGFWTELREGWSELKRHRWYWTNMLTHAAWNLGRAVYQSLGPVIAVESLGGNEAWGLMTEGGVIGALAGALIAVRLRPKRPLIVANVGLAIGGIPLILLAVAAPACSIAIAAGATFAGLTVMQALWNTALHQNIAGRALSRVSAYDTLVSFALMPIGLTLAAPISAIVGAPATLIGAGVLVCVSSALVILVPDVRALGASPAAPAPVAEALPSPA